MSSKRQKQACKALKNGSYKPDNKEWSPDWKPASVRSRDLAPENDSLKLLLDAATIKLQLALQTEKMDAKLKYTLNYIIDKVTQESLKTGNKIDFNTAIITNLQHSVFIREGFEILFDISLSQTQIESIRNNKDKLLYAIGNAFVKKVNITISFFFEKFSTTCFARCEVLFLKNTCVEAPCSSSGPTIHR